MKIIHLLLALLFAICAAVQYNDPDPLGWVAVYLAGAGLAAMAAYGSRSMAAPAVLALVCVGWMATLSGGFGDYLAQGDPALLTAAMRDDQPFIEESREFVGLGLIALYCILLLVAAWRGPSEPAPAAQ